MNDKVAPLPEDVDILEETPGQKALREAQESGATEEDIKKASVDPEKDKSPYEALDELYSPDRPPVR